MDIVGNGIGIILGNFVPNTGPALQKGKFVGVSVLIDEYIIQPQIALNVIWTATAIGLLVMMYPNLVQSQVRGSESYIPETRGLDLVQHCNELACCSILDGKLPTF